MSAATAERIEFPEPDYGDGDGDDGDGSWLVLFLARLQVRVRERGELHGAVFQSELYNLFAEYADHGNLPSQADAWRAAAKKESPE